MTYSTFDNLDKKKQNRIFRAALKEFSAKGYAGASINNIVADLGIAKGSIFQYFGDKEGLFTFVVLRSLDMVKAHLKSVRDQTINEDFFSRIETLFISGISFLRKHPRIYSLYTKILYEGNLKFISRLLGAIRAESYQFLSKMIQQGIERGQVRKDIDITCAAFFLDSVLDRFLQAFMLRHFGQHPGIYKAKDQEIHNWATTLVGLLRQGMEAK